MPSGCIMSSKRVWREAGVGTSSSVFDTQRTELLPTGREDF